MTRRRDWSLVEGKRRWAAGRPCPVCGQHRPLEAAHVIGRARDAVQVSPDSVIFLCGPFPGGCHGRYDRHELDLYPFLSAAELRQAVVDAGSPGMALRRLSPDIWAVIGENDVVRLEERLKVLESL